ncbi:MAG: hypothetical protein V3T16_05880, partial [Gemmatimonadales bacterium]
PEVGRIDSEAFPDCNPPAHGPIKLVAMDTLAPGVRTLTKQQRAKSADPETVEVALAASGDASAFERLYHRHAPACIA